MLVKGEQEDGTYAAARQHLELTQRVSAHLWHRLHVRLAAPAASAVAAVCFQIIRNLETMHD